MGRPQSVWERAVPFPCHPTGSWALTLSPSGKRLVALPTGAGEPRDLTRTGFDYSRYFLRSGAWFPDSRRVIFSAWQNGVLRTFVQDIDGGEPRAVGPPGVGGAAASPDGRHIFAGRFDGPASIYDLDGGDPTPIKGLETGDYPIRWSQDGRSLICRRQQGLVTEVSAIEIATGRRVPLWHLAAIDPAGADTINSLAVTPDGKSYAYSYYRNISDLYVVDGLK
jgi:eukaryotic-like serine/threonine-protein kinase